MNALIIIPARMASTRLPNKMLAAIGEKPLIAHTYESVVASQVGDVIVACDAEEIACAIRKVGGTAILTDHALSSGTDRVFAALTQYDPAEKYEFIINVQGDMPFIAPEFIRGARAIVEESNYDMSTLATPIEDDAYLIDSVVKPAIAFTSRNSGQALYFSRSPIPHGGPYFHHVGIYCFRRKALEKYVSLPQSPLEKTEKLEQLRMLENQMTIGITVVDQASPISVDTPTDLERAREFYAASANER
ncbi:MAG: 3-deoxy-manno-octulosonate cytidylyltransferase [Holosporaceae bacterium]|nr:3-deoxy-manno-octulosonate cytidylyltransferase [Holosporaceae bacterium]